MLFAVPVIQTINLLCSSQTIFVVVLIIVLRQSYYIICTYYLFITLGLYRVHTVSFTWEL